ncbi:hypothetical protein SOVF_182330 [Spinacia oleracea]|nr:hypothetical protein SOVF_182330 [Spinacia oleracea]
MIKLKLVMEKLQKSFSLGKRLSMSDVEDLQEQHDHDEEPTSCHHFGDSRSTAAPPSSEDVKEGHFTAVAVDGDEARRFVVPLRYLTHPMFLALLEKAAEEYGFDHGGALTIPCRPSEIESILGERWNGGRPSSSRRRSNDNNNNNCRRNSNDFMIQSY